MFSMKDDTHLFIAMCQWIEKGENDKVKHILEKMVATDVANDDNQTLLHCAARHGNLNIVEQLLTMACEIDPKDGSNQTPLNLAVGHRQWGATKFLLRHNADIYAADDTSESPLSKIVCDVYPNLEVLQMFLDSAKNKSEDKEEFVDILVRYGCRLKNVVRLRDADLTEMFLNNPDADLYEPIWKDCSVDIAMRSIDEKNMRVLLHHVDTDQISRRRAFIFCLRCLLKDFFLNDSWSYTVDVAVEQFVKWQLLDDEESIALLQMIYQILPEVCLQQMLSDNVLAYVGNVLNYDVRIHLFGNVNCCIRDMIERGEVDTNLIDRNGRSTLHVAVQNGALGIIDFLVDSGMSPNIRDENGKTPIFEIRHDKQSSKVCLAILLHRGADLQATDNEGRTYIDCYQNPDFSHDLIKIIIAHLAILEVTGVPLKEPFRNYVQASEETLNYFLSCCEQLEKIKTVEVVNSTTLFEILTENIEILSKRVNPLYREIFEKFFLPHSTGLQGYDPYYASAVTSRVKRASTMGNLRKRATIVIGDSIEMLKSFDLVIEIIVSFLSYRDLKVFLPRFLQNRGRPCQAFSK